MATQKKKIKVSHIFILLAAITTVVVGVLGYHWEETAENPFWYSFWPIAAVTCDAAWVILWAIFWTREKGRR
jgi:hypothetical protein